MTFHMKNTEKIFTSVVQSYQKPLYWYIRRLVVSHEDSEDILQETFIRAFKNLWQLRDESSLKPWLYRIATGEISRFFRKNRIHMDSMEEVSPYLLEQLMDSSYVDYTKEAEINLQKALLTLSPQQRTVFCLRYYDEMDYKEISYITGSTESTLKVAYHNARQKVEKYLTNE